MINEEAFVCPYCKKSEGFMSVQSVRGTQMILFNNFGEEIDGDMQYSHMYKEKFYCESCGKGITKAVKRYLGGQE